MTEQPNIKRELLEWALEQWDGDGCIHFREFADETITVGGVSERR